LVRVVRDPVLFRVRSAVLVVARLVTVALSGLAVRRVPGRVGVQVVIGVSFQVLAGAAARRRWRQPPRV
jgi:uncharacterized membrane protein YhiD involved in acid resistance